MSRYILYLAHILLNSLVTRWFHTIHYHAWNATQSFVPLMTSLQVGPFQSNAKYPNFQ